MHGRFLFPARICRAAAAIALVWLTGALSVAPASPRIEPARIDPSLPESVRTALRQFVLTIRMDRVRVQMSAHPRFRVAEAAYHGQPGEVRFTPTCLWRVTGEVACATPVPADHRAFQMADAQNAAQGAPRLFAADREQPSAWDERPSLPVHSPRSQVFLLPVARVRDGALELSALRCQSFLGVGRRRAKDPLLVGTYAACDPPSQPYDVAASVGLSPEGVLVAYVHGAYWDDDDAQDELFSAPAPLHEVLRFIDGEQFPDAAIFGAGTWDGELEQGSGTRLPKRDEHGNLSCGPELSFTVQNTEVRARSDRACNLARLDLSLQDGRRLRLHDPQKSEDEYLFDEEDAAGDDLVEYPAFLVARERPWRGLSPRTPMLVSTWTQVFLARGEADRCAMYYPIGFAEYTWNRSWRMLPGLFGKVAYPFGCVDPSAALGRVSYGSGRGSASLVQLAGRDMIVGIAHIEATGFAEGVHSFFPGMPQRGQALGIGDVAYVPADPEPFWISAYAGGKPALPVRESLPVPGERMHLFGYPGGMGPVHSRCVFAGPLPTHTQHLALCHLATVKMDEVSSWIAEQGAGDVATQLLKLYQGNSGGPYVDEQGAFVGSVSNGSTFLVTRPASAFADVISLMGFSPAYALLNNPTQSLGEAASRHAFTPDGATVIDLPWKDGFIVDCGALLQQLQRSTDSSIPDPFSSGAYAWLVREEGACTERS